jgi:hypothetical protein
VTRQEVVEAAGAAECAPSKGVPVVEGYPVDDRDEKVELTMAYVGTRRLIGRAGLTKGGRHRVGVRRLPPGARAAAPRGKRRDVSASR